MQLCDAASESRMRVKCLGTLGCLAQHPTSIEGNRVCAITSVQKTSVTWLQVIADYLVSVMPTSSTPSPAGTEAMIEAVSQLIDVFSDENLPYDINFRNSCVLDKMIDSLEGVQKAIKGIDSRVDEGRVLRWRGEEVRDNLKDFIEYRKGLSC